MFTHIMNVHSLNISIKFRKTEFSGLFLSKNPIVIKDIIILIVIYKKSPRNCTVSENISLLIRKRNV